MRKKNKIFIVCLSAMFTMMFMNVKVEVFAMPSNNVDLSKSFLNNYPDTPEINELKNKINDEALYMQSKTIYCEVRESITGTEIVRVLESEQEYQLERFKKSISTFDLPLTQDFGWIKLSLECYLTGGNNFMACGSYNWLKKPTYAFVDVFGIGHDATSTFDNQSAFAYFFAPYYDVLGDHQEMESHTAAEGGYVKTDANGVAFKFNLRSLSNEDEDPNTHDYPFGMMYVNGTFTNSVGGNLQVSYGHSQLSISFDVLDAVKFAASGEMNFDIFGSQDTVTCGDRVLLK